MMYEIRTLDQMRFIYHPELGAIPEDEMNPNYLEYVAWLFEGNTPEEVNIEIIVKEEI